jgi:hypothetical protein
MALMFNNPSAKCHTDVPAARFVGRRMVEKRQFSRICQAIESEFTKNSVPATLN